MLRHEHRLPGAPRPGERTPGLHLWSCHQPTFFIFYLCGQPSGSPARGSANTMSLLPWRSVFGGGGAGGARAGPKAWCWEAVTGAAEAQRPLNATLILRIRHFGELTPARVRSASTPLQPEWWCDPVFFKIVHFIFTFCLLTWFTSFSTFDTAQSPESCSERFWEIILSSILPGNSFSMWVSRGLDGCVAVQLAWAALEFLNSLARITTL